MKSIKLLLVIIAFMAVFSNEVFADSIVLPDTTVNGKILYVLDGFTEIKTIEGLKRFNRIGTTKSYNDIVIVGIFKKKKITGHIFYADDNTVEILTPSGNLKLSRFYAKNIILFQ